MRGKIGKTQIAVLQAMVRHDVKWGTTSAWVWDTQSNTRRIMQSLLKRGLVRYDANERKFILTDFGKRIALRNTAEIS